MRQHHPGREMGVGFCLRLRLHLRHLDAHGTAIGHLLRFVVVGIRGVDKAKYEAKRTLLGEDNRQGRIAALRSRVWSCQ